MNIYKEMGLKEVINANGKMTILGASVVSDEIAEAMQSGLQNFVVIEDLMHHAGRVISKKTGAEAGCPTCGAASGMAIAVAAAIAGENLNLIERMPNSHGLQNEIIIQKGQVVNFGGNLAQMIRIGGGIPIEVGCANKVEAAHIEGAITERTAALFYVKSHHAVQKGMQSIAVMKEIAHRYGLPLIVDAAAEEDLKKYAAMDADMVIYSGGKAISGPTSGFICGKQPYISACHKQYKGIGRAMKVSKEALVGLMTALDHYAPDENATVDRQKREMELVCSALSEVDGLSCRIVQDEAGREIYRAEIHINASKTGITAAELSAKLKSGDPAIYLREYYVNQGVLSVDPRPLFEGQALRITQQIKAYLTEGI